MDYNHNGNKFKKWQAQYQYLDAYDMRTLPQAKKLDCPSMSDTTPLSLYTTLTNVETSIYIKIFTR